MNNKMNYLELIIVNVDFDMSDSSYMIVPLIFLFIHGIYSWDLGKIIISW